MMEPQTPQNDTTVGRAEVPEIVLTHAHQRSLLAGTLSRAHVAPANSARRRLYGPTLLGSPARRGHSPAMVDLFGDAKNNLASQSVPAVRTENIRPTLRQLPLRPKPPQIEAVQYPVLSPGELDATKTVLSPPVEHAHSPRRLSPEPGPSSHSYFDRPPQIRHAQGPQIVPMHTIQTSSFALPSSSESSASWTGDSEFYRPAPPPPIRERQPSVPEWLATLPAEPDEFEDADCEQTDVVPISPNVELERGSMRFKVKGSPEKARRCSVEDQEDSEEMDIE